VFGVFRQIVVRRYILSHTDQSSEATPASDDLVGGAMQPTCTNCGSQKLIPNVIVRDEGLYSSGYLQACVDAAPNAILFHDPICVRYELNRTWCHPEHREGSQAGMLSEAKHDIPRGRIKK
jgi:hypothetical protein